jgi:DNA (cytosine-5)-methyltransferase 1
MKRQRPVAVDLFAGAGGLSLGFEQAGFDVAAAVEIDPVHACVHQFNFPNCAVIPRSVAQISSQDIRVAAGLSPGTPIDVVMGGAPCQGFSLMGQRALDDPRNALVREFIRLVCDLQPTYFLLENVRGLTIGRHCEFLEEIIQVLGEAGYATLHPWKVLNARDFGVPQHRERLFLIGAKEGNALPQYPKRLDNWVTCALALEDLPDAECFEQLTVGDEVRADYMSSPNHYSALMRPCKQEDWQQGYPRQWRPEFLTSSRRTEHSAISRRRFAQTAPGTREPISRFFKLAADRVATTLRAGTNASRGSFTSPRPIHYQYARCVTVREMARLHGFPDWFRFHETKWHGARQVGNSVPPPLAWAIATEFIKVLQCPPSYPAKVLPLGERALLQTTMSSAASYWGVANPIAKRDRKSHQRKRKQADIEALYQAQGKLFSDF